MKEKIRIEVESPQPGRAPRVEKAMIYGTDLDSCEDAGERLATIVRRLLSATEAFFVVCAVQAARKGKDCGLGPGVCLQSAENCIRSVAGFEGQMERMLKQRE